jgi:cytochrome P450
MFISRIKDDGRVLRKGAELLIVIDQIHRNPKYHPNPSEFNPERFAAENIRQMDTYSYLPFSHGPRNCIGIRNEE